MGYGLKVVDAMIISFFSGATMMGCLGVGLYFLRFWKKTRDRFFILFAVAFGFLALERLIAVLLDLPNEARPLLYAIRLFAFVLILIAIIDKNWSNR